MCLDRNEVEVTEFLEKLRRRLLRTVIKPTWLVKRSSGPSTIKGFLDFSKIEEISTSAALVLAAEYERIVHFVKAPPPLVNLDAWNDDVFKRLFELGFFEIIGTTPPDQERYLTADKEVMTLRFISGSNAAETRLAGEMLIRLAEFLDPDHELPEEISVPLTSALSEAMSNVREHAYPADYRFRYRHVGRWWLTGSADRRNRTLTIVIYDQGASIPVTYERLSSLAHVRKWIDEVRGTITRTTSHPFQNDGLQIAAAVKFGNSQTDEPHRGKGLPDMKFAVDQCKNGKLSILSRGGRYVYNGLTDQPTHSSYAASIGGTLIEWTMTLPPFERVKE
ncbi:MAG: hypothetical protein DI589_23025 [Shinella sp.]|nr:MAG: hypothetical protein DI589_23025 [Shinella sp.]